jgi:hypothetical protein
MFIFLSKRAARHAGPAKDRARAREFKALIANQAALLFLFEQFFHDGFRFGDVTGNDFVQFIDSVEEADQIGRASCRERV